ncbi:TetR/AcrR family transcriptional regulator [Actinokineospora soli]|uniref:TetR/AcrR family transcriptional regulator n=1 Tax=Actinokineospora soli TaxID=1048753 RepID=A0ABW2TRW7_9PSEU
MPRKPDPDARQRILDVATRLFTAHGVHQVGMQQVIDELGCGKNLLYREFASKDDLVVAYLGKCKDSWRALFDEAGEGHEDDPAGHMLALVDVIAAQVVEPDFRGCAIHNTYAEFPEPDHPAHRVATEHFENVHRHLLELATRAGADDPTTLADRVLLIIEGIYANGLAMGRDGAARAASDFAAEVVRRALEPRAAVQEVG